MDKNYRPVLLTLCLLSRRDVRRAHFISRLRERAAAGRRDVHEIMVKL